MYDIFYLGDNSELKERYPFAKQITSEKDVVSKTRLYWLLEEDIKITDWGVFDYVPDIHTVKYNHIWKWNSSNYGGVHLKPKKQTSFIDTMHHNNVICAKVFTILHKLTPENYFKTNITSTHVWCVDPEYKLADDIDWAPGNFEPNFIHSFHLRGQLEHKYPAEEGGIKLFPRDWEKCDTKYHGFLDANIIYPILYVDDVEDYAQRDIFNEDYVWLIDKAHSINVKTVDWVPNPFEDNMVHAFKMPYQLQEKYPLAMGGIRLIPNNWSNAETKIHPACPIEDKNYDVFYIDESEFTAETYSEYAERSKTDWFWIVDREYLFNGKLLFVPAEHERDYIHVFKIPGHLEERYPLDNTDPWDNRCGGIKLINKQFDITKHKYQEDICPVRYDIFYSDNINDYETYARKSRTKMFWLIDSEHQINEEFKYVPLQFDQKYIHVFKFPDDLEHKYPRAIKNISDNRAGGIKLVPKNVGDDAKFIDSNPVGGRSYPIVYSDGTLTEVDIDCWIIPEAFNTITSINWSPTVFQKHMKHIFNGGQVVWMPRDWNGEVKVHDISPVQLNYEFQTFNNYEEGIAQSKYDWFWVIDPDVVVLEDFDLDFQPNVFDEGKQHVWQKLNPVTGKQYDYGGVSLRHKREGKGRPKYIREPACTQKEYPVYHIQPEELLQPLDDVYERLCNRCGVGMMWVVDAHIEVYDDFDFSYYPTQYDKDVVHIWQHDGNSKQSGIKLMPMGTYSEQEIKENSYVKLKEMPSVASKDPVWPVEQLENMTSAEIQGIIDTHKDVGYVWTVDPDIELDDNIIKQSIIPHVDNSNIVHVWKRTDSEGLVIGHGGLRLWPTTYDATQLTDEQVLTCSIPDQLILDAVAGEQKEYPICYLNSDTDILEQLNQFDTDCESTMYWVVDPHITLAGDWKFDYVPTKWEEHVVHVWLDSEDNKRGVRLIPKNTFTDNKYTIKQLINNTFTDLKTVYRVASQPTTWKCYAFNTETPLLKQLNQFKSQNKAEYFYTIDPDVTVIDEFKFNYTPQLDSLNKIHTWQRTNPRTNMPHSYGGIRLWHKSIEGLTSDDIQLNKMPRGTLQYVKATASVYKPYHIVLITYKQNNTDELLSRLPEGTLLVKDVEGIFNAHKQASTIVDTSMFWVVDGDAEVMADFDFGYIPDVYDQDVTHVWNSANPVTGDTYGYGGVKLFNTNQIRGATTWGIDFTTGLSKRFKVMPEVACTTRFNTDAYSTWRSAFRECVKLATSSDPDAQQRLGAWLHPVPDADFRHEAKLGAEQGNDYAGRNRGNITALELINDYDWLKEYYDGNN